MFKKNKIFPLIELFGSLVIICFYLLIFIRLPQTNGKQIIKKNLFTVQSVDTMKESRDRARIALKDPNYNKVILNEVLKIKDLGATHVGVSTPYDPEFLPVIRQWAEAAHKNGLAVWFRGNFSGWEGWFGYKKINRQQHEQMLKEFILGSPDLFSGNDIFSPCPECENGGPGDPRATGDIEGFRKFIINEQIIAQDAFNEIKKNVSVPAPGMNGDVAQLIMDPKTTEALGGTVIIDHYVALPEKFKKDIEDIANQSQGFVSLGEFGAPIPNIHGVMTEDEQAGYIEKLLQILFQNQKLIPAINYWTFSDSSTALVNKDGSLRPAYNVLKKYFSASYIYGRVTDNSGKALGQTNITLNSQTSSYNFTTDKEGYYQIFIPENQTKLTFEKEGHIPQIFETASMLKPLSRNVELEPIYPSVLHRIKAIFN